MHDRRHLAVHQPRGAHHLAAEHLDQRLMAETHAEYRNAPGEGFDHAIDTPASRGVPGPGRDHQVRVIRRQRLLDVDGIVAVHIDFGSQNQERLHQVVGE